MRNKILELRKHKGFTQDQLAKKCNVSRQTINAIENDRYDPTLQLAFKIARVLNTTVDDVFNT
ncbi:helix-turn-helix transcriptional regulator [Virgibacillus halodenitrificans]|uniref:helix-turn-helix transcriptional regulator n=1 Tax=Virgibacillus halodenitrificans TaxID=1482 RepID=UPI001F16CB9B|nr:helix-turn-helix transcriptional regulator [Virgibacillus halodenitrificans]MCG1029398.1 helix-turn-helix transcriptional regulator [Virgibacillus halodenitrificans]MEC2159226.1 helix-turn-helix transcriptional regulator [Virgibacillus halodenitrificans]